MVSQDKIDLFERDLWDATERCILEKEWPTSSLKDPWGDITCIDYTQPHLGFKATSGSPFMCLLICRDFARNENTFGIAESVYLKLSRRYNLSRDFIAGAFHGYTSPTYNVPLYVNDFDLGKTFGKRVRVCVGSMT